MESVKWEKFAGINKPGLMDTKYKSTTVEANKLDDESLDFPYSS